MEKFKLQLKETSVDLRKQINRTSVRVDKDLLNDSQYYITFYNYKKDGSYADIDDMEIFLAYGELSYYDENYDEHYIDNIDDIYKFITGTLLLNKEWTNKEQFEIFQVARISRLSNIEKFDFEIASNSCGRWIGDEMFNIFENLKNIHLLMSYEHNGNIPFWVHSIPNEKHINQYGDKFEIIETRNKEIEKIIEVEKLKFELKKQKQNEALLKQTNKPFKI